MTTITALPPAPNRADPLNFANVADTWVAALPTFGTECNAVAGEINIDASTAQTAANTATAAASAATAAANAVLWVSGTTYSIGNVVFSPINFLSYRRKTNGAGTTDPSLDSTNWASIAGTGDVNTTATQTLTNKTLNSVILNDGYTEEVFTVTGTNYALLSANGSIQQWTLTANSVLTDSLTSGQTVILMVNDGTAFALTFPTTSWTKSGGGGTAPSLNTSGYTCIVFWKVGSTLYGSYLGDA
jgi:hypothetical protein